MDQTKTAVVVTNVVVFKIALIQGQAASAFWERDSKEADAEASWEAKRWQVSM
jgi:hypothetical protein